jgi:uncharacterized membrane protein YqjE
MGVGLTVVSILGLVGFAFLPPAALLPNVSILFHGVVCLLILSVEFKGDCFEPIITIVAGTFVVFVIIPAIQLATGIYATPGISFLKDSFVKAELASAGAMLSLYLGYNARLGRGIRRVIPVPAPAWDRHKVFLVVVLFSLAAVFGFIWLSREVGGFDVYVSHLHNRSRLVQGRGHIIEVVRLGPVAMTMAFLEMITERRRTIWRAIFVCLLILNSVLLSLQGGSSAIIGSLVALLFVWNYLRKRLRPSTLVVFLLLALAGALWYRAMRESTSLYDQDRTLLGLAGAPRSEDVYSVGGLIAGFNAMEPFVGLLELMTSPAEFRYGLTYVEGFAALLPRSLFPGKGAGASWEINKIVTGTEFYHTTDLEVAQSASAVGWIHELYLNFYFPGVLAGFFIAGVLLSGWYSYLRSHSDNMSVLLFAGLLFQAFGMASPTFFEEVIYYVPRGLVILMVIRFVGLRPAGKAVLRSTALPRTARPVVIVRG